MSNETFEVLGRSDYSFGRWLAPRIGTAVLAVAALAGMIEAGQLLIR